MASYYYDSLGYANVNKEQYSSKNHGKSVKQVTAETFWKLLNEIAKNAIDKEYT